MSYLKRPQFSARTFAIFVSLICFYFGMWELTKRSGVCDTQTLLQEYDDAGYPVVAAITPPVETSPMPFVIRRTVYGYMDARWEYYIWFFGCRVKLPLER
jgi:hypothetical protein